MATTSYFSDRITSPNGDTALPTPFSPTTPSAASSAVRTNALQTRITSVLSASYADLEIRDALAILDERELKNTAETRRNIRLDVQQELIECNGEIVQDFGKVADQLKRIGQAIANLNHSCSEMRKHISAANRETGPMLDEAKTILHDKEQVETKQQLLDAFRAHFIISDVELAQLTSTAEPVNDDFFRVLTRVKKIHQDCQILLGSENERLGLEIVEQSSRQLNAALQKLFRWVQREFKSLDLENPQISASIRRALRVLAERPALFQGCLDFFAESREHILSNNFYAALTGTAADPDQPVMGKAIELSAHDPLRYIGDMLAWAHSATVSEREALEVLFISDGDEIAKSIQAGIESEPWTRTDNDEEIQPFDGRRALRELVDRNLAGVFHQLKQRIEQVISSHEDAPLSYRISNLITFYTNIFIPLLGESSSLLAQLRPLSDTAMRAFQSTMRNHVASLQTDLSLSPDDLAPPDFLTDALETLHLLMASYDTSAALSLSRADRRAHFQPVLREALDPFLAGCENLTHRLRAPAAHILALNCLGAVRATLATHAFAERDDELAPRLAEHAALLTDSLHAWFLRESGLKPLVDTLAVPDDLGSSYSDPSALAAAATKVDGFLPTAIEDARGVLVQLEDVAGVGRKVVEDAAERFCEDFERVEALILRADEIRAEHMARERARDGVQMDEEDEEDLRLRDVFPRTTSEIRVLLS